MDWVKKHLQFLLEAIGIVGLVIYFVTVPTGQRVLLGSCLVLLLVGKFWGVIVKNIAQKGSNIAPNQTAQEESKEPRPAGTVVK